MKKGIRKPEILAPVGGQEQLLAAVRSGCNAVYFGLSNFNARQNAKNFADDTLAETIDYCHVRGVKVFITINTLVMDHELEAVKAAVDTAAGAGADALIIQDLAVAAYAKKAWPGVKLIASTQMAVHNAAGAEILRDYGFDRVVLARELSLEEIRTVIEKTGVEAESFVHGAHCMSLSGACYMSSMIGARSGNRGLCAQPCRLDWSFRGKDHVLSLKDMSYIDHIGELAEAGVCSLKIEGRMKRAEYVAAAVTACKNAEEGIPYDAETLKAVFSRSGFTDGYLEANRGPHMFGYRTKEDVMDSASVLKELAATYEKEPQNIAVSMFLNVSEGQPSSLIVSDGENSIEVLGDIPQQAKTLPLNEEYARRSLEKTGGTPYYLDSFELYCEDGLMLPASALNALRRDALEQLTKQRADNARPDNSAARENGASASLNRLGARTSSAPRRYRLRFEIAEQAFAEEDCDIVLPADEILNHPDIAEKTGRIPMAELPAIIWPGDEDKIAQKLEKLASMGITDAACENIGAVQLAQNAGLTPRGGFTLNIMNSESLEQYAKLGLADSCYSMELEFAKARGMKKAIPAGTVVYGYLPLMKFRACPAMGENGCGGCTGFNYLTDRTGAQFKLLCRNRRYSELFNCLPVYVGDKNSDFADFKLLYFTNESKDRCREILSLVKNRLPFDEKRTQGLFYRELL